MGKQGEWLSVTGSAADYLWAAGFNWPAGGQCLKAASPQAWSCWCCQGPRPRVSVACRSACRRQQGNSVACYDACGRQQGMHSDMASCQAAAWVQPLTLSAQATQLPPSWKRRDESEASGSASLSCLGGWQPPQPLLRGTCKGTAGLVQCRPVLLSSRMTALVTGWFDGTIMWLEDTFS